MFFCRIVCTCTLIFALSATRVHALAVITPLYHNPDSTCAAWDSYSKIIQNHPHTTFYTIINPDHGPGAANSQPRGGYQACVRNLRPSANPNAIVLGYVDTKSASTVLADIDTYAGWQPTYRPTGIFMDNVTATAEKLEMYSGYVSHAKSKGFTFTGLNTGGPAEAAYYPLVDLINTYSAAYSSFNPTSFSSSSNSASTPISKQSVWLLDTSPSTIGRSSGLLNQLGAAGLGAVFMSNETTAVGLSGLPPNFAAFVEDVATAKNLAPSSSSGPSASLNSQGSVPTSSSHAAENSKSSPPIAAIVGGVLGGLVVFLVLLVIVLCMRRRKHPSEQELQPQHAEMTPFQVCTPTNPAYDASVTATPELWPPRGSESSTVPGEQSIASGPMMSGKRALMSAAALPSMHHSLRGTHSPSPSVACSSPAAHTIYSSSATSDAGASSEDWDRLMVAQQNPPPYSPNPTQH
ncbi:Spherulation-specific family 4-domain-containing protein [Favolaschia claudopus]|uniref:Spherulation-specific family 4-domain-containing protein n=1 Tax=Favolaschia claudopus TaxID=2862362 RepID=A0AAW0C928_9AGAR